MLYRTSDLYWAALLRVSGIPLQSTEREKQKVTFVFEDPGDNVIKNLKDDYFMDKAKVSALSYSQSLKSLKALIHHA